MNQSNGSLGTEQARRDAKADTGRRPTVLVVDDDEAMLESCPQVLEKAGFEVTAVADGHDALELMRQKAVDVVILDLKMPGLSGQQVLERIKQTDPEAVVVVITGYPELSSAVEVMKAGAYDFLPKPFGAEELRIITRRAYEKRKLALAVAAGEREKQRMRDNFVAMVSHQLKSPAASLKECLDAALAACGGQLPPRARELLSRAAGKAQLLLNLMDDWLTLARVESGGLAEEKKPVNLRALAERAVAAVSGAPEHNKVAVRIECQEPELTVCADEDALSELLCNLLDNAMRYTPDGGQVRVRLRQEADHAVLTVEDTGPGIAPQEQQVIFEPFYRGHSGKGKHGTGLGLAIVKQIALAHGGRVSVESTPGHGTAFTVHLPMKEEGS